MSCGRNVRYSTRSIGGRGFEFWVDGRNYDEGGKVEQALQRRGAGAAVPEPGAWRIELAPEADSLEDQFLVVLLPSRYGERRNDQVRLLRSAEEVGCEIVGATLTTQWWFKPGHLGARIEVLGQDSGTLGRISPP